MKAVTLTFLPYALVSCSVLLSLYFQESGEITIRILGRDPVYLLQDLFLLKCTFVNVRGRPW